MLAYTGSIAGQLVICIQTVEWIKMPFGMDGPLDHGPNVLDGGGVYYPKMEIGPYLEF